MEYVGIMNPEVKKADVTMGPLLRSLTILNPGQNMDETEVIRQGLHGKQEELQIVTILIPTGEI
jgi:hypothetical protein